MYTRKTQNVIKMPNLTLAIPEELQKIVKEHNEVNWSEVARRAMWEHANKLEIMDRLVKDSKLTERDVKEIDAKIKAGLRRRYFK